MNPFQAIQYMKETGKPVKAEKTPSWIDNPQWIEWQYSLKDDSVVSSFRGEVVIQEASVAEWLNWWMNFCYNTNSSHHNVELIPI